MSPLASWNARRHAVHVRPNRAAGGDSQHRTADRAAAVHLRPAAARAADDVVLEDLVAFYRDPVKGFFRALDYTLPWDVDGIEDAMPVDINALEEWTVGDRMLQDILRGMTPNEAREAEWCRGTLPPGQLGGAKPRRSRSGDAARRDRTPTALPSPGIRRRHRRRLWTAADRNGVAGVWRHGVGDVLQARRQALLASWIPLLALFAVTHKRLARCVHRSREEARHPSQRKASDVPKTTRPTCAIWCDGLRRGTS